MPHLRTTEILEILQRNPGSYIQHSMGNYRIKNKDGSDMENIIENRNYLIEPTKEMMDDLLFESRIKLDGNFYVLI